MERETDRLVFPADDYPHGPITVRISGVSDVLKDNCYLQLYNTGGTAGNAGMPKEAPPAAKGMSLVFADDFDGPLSISSTDPKAKYYDHKPPDGSQDFSSHPFAGISESAKNPFKQVDTYLRIRASDKLNSAGADFVDEKRRHRRSPPRHRVISNVGSSGRMRSGRGRRFGC